MTEEWRATLDLKENFHAMMESGQDCTEVVIVDPFTGGQFMSLGYLSPSESLESWALSHKASYEGFARMVIEKFLQ